MGLFADGDPKFDAIYAEEAAMVDSAELIAVALEHANISRTQLAEKLGVSKAEITHRLRGERNITVRKLASTLHCLNAELILNVRLTDFRKASPADRWITACALREDESQTTSVHGYRLPERIAA